jgi:hypothetical protein
MLQTFRRRASRIGLSSNKFIITVDLQSLEIHHDEYLFPLDSLVSIILERGVKFSSSSEKELSTETLDINPLKRRSIGKEEQEERNIEKNGSTPLTLASPDQKRKSVASQNSSHIGWNEKLELVATLYKDNSIGIYQEKDVNLKLKTIRKEDYLSGIEKYTTVGKYSLNISEIINEMNNESISSMFYEKEMKILFSSFEKTSLSFLLRITPLFNQFNNNPFNQFLYTINSPGPSLHHSSALLDASSGGMNGETRERNGENDDAISVSSMISGENSDDIGFDYHDLKETRGNSQRSKSGLFSSVLSSPSSLLQLNFKRENSHNISPEEISSVAVGTPQRPELRDTFYSQQFGKKSKEAKGRSRSMIVVGSNHKMMTVNGKDNFSSKEAHLQSKSLSALFPSAETENEDRVNNLTQEEQHYQPSSPQLSPKTKVSFFVSSLSLSHFACFLHL